MDIKEKKNDLVQGEKIIRDIPKTELNQSEIDGIVLMREEEKLARDVYTTLGTKWNLNIFSNIAKSEQTHMDAVKTLLDRYNIKDPAENNIGQFTSKKLSDLYDQLIKKGEESSQNALIVGATVEDLDIKDLNDLSNQTNKSDILAIYDNLKRGSRNHLRSFVKQIENNSGNYNPQYISLEEYNSIISSQQEKGSTSNGQGKNKK